MSASIDVERIVPDSTPEQLDAAFQVARATFREGVTKTYEWRIAQLQAAKRMFTENEAAIVLALYKDLRRPK